MDYAHFDPTPFVAGDFELASRGVTIAQGQNAVGAPLRPGTVLGQQTNLGAATYAAKGGNTG
jgi:hypothetical protein